MNGEGVHRKPPLENLTLLPSCSHEEADCLMLLHTSHAAKHNHHKILIRMVGTYVSVLVMSMAYALQSKDELWLAYGTGKSCSYFAAHEIAAGLGPEKARALSMFHVLTGYDNVSSFAGHGKKTAWAVWKVLPELTYTLVVICTKHHTGRRAVLYPVLNGLSSSFTIGPAPAMTSTKL